MARYRKIDTRIWNDAKFNELSQSGKLVFFFLLTHPNLTMLGAMRASIPGLAAEIGTPPEAFAEAFREGLTKGMVKHDEKASFLWLTNFLKYNRPESPNVVKSWPEAFDLLPECELKTALFQQLKAFVEGLSKAFHEAFMQAFAKTLPNQEQEQEQEQEIHKPKVDFDIFLSAWNQNCGDLPKALKLSAGRRKKLSTRIESGLTPEDFTTAVQLCAKTPFLRGENERRWRATFDWLIKNEENLLKVLEGKYGQSETPQFSQTKPAFKHRSTSLSMADIRNQAGVQ